MAELVGPRTSSAEVGLQNRTARDTPGSQQMQPVPAAVAAAAPKRTGVANTTLALEPAAVAVAVGGGASALRHDDALRQCWRGPLLPWMDKMAAVENASAAAAVAVLAAGSCCSNNPQGTLAAAAAVAAAAAAVVAAAQRRCSSGLPSVRSSRTSCAYARSVGCCCCCCGFWRRWVA